MGEWEVDRFDRNLYMTRSDVINPSDLVLSRCTVLLWYHIFVPSIVIALLSCSAYSVVLPVIWKGELHIAGCLATGITLKCRLGSRMITLFDNIVTYSLCIVIVSATSQAVNNCSCVLHDQRNCTSSLKQNSRSSVIPTYFLSHDVTLTYSINVFHNLLATVCHFVSKN